MKKELLFILFVLLLFYGLHGFPLDFNVFLEDATLDINVYDTYFVVSNVLYLAVGLSFLFAICYFVRVVSTNFRNQYANYIYLIVNLIFFILSIYVIQFFISIFSIFQEKGYNVEESIQYMYYGFIGFAILSIVLEILVFMKVRKQRTLG